MPKAEGLNSWLVAMMQSDGGFNPSAFGFQLSQRHNIHISHEM